MVKEDESGGEMEAVSVSEPGSAESSCDPEISSAIGNLDEEAMRQSIMNTYNSAVDDQKKECELPKI